MRQRTWWGVGLTTGDSAGTESPGEAVGIRGRWGGWNFQSFCKEEKDKFEEETQFTVN